MTVLPVAHRIENIPRRPSWRLFILALGVFLVALFFLFPRQRSCYPACVVLFGDSITSRWRSLEQTKALSGLQVINRGIPGDSTSHMLSRFNRDVVQLRPRVVVILGGINDIVRIPLPSIERNLEKMAATADQHGIHVVLATLSPVGEYDPGKPSPSLTSGNDEIRSLNGWIKNLAATKHYTLVDYHSVLADERGYFVKGLSTDGVHPSAQGYERMEPLLREAVQSALGHRP